MEQPGLPKRDFFAWLGVFADVMQTLLYLSAGIGAIYWLVRKPDGLPAVISGLVVLVAVLIGAVAYLIFMNRRR